uniref:Serine-threonine/tyrosine-protein kinase catalytic domain-containing protein n=1 Tax=Rhizophagus irregularis (strain DAOM 181602 / DAOM 197198 / MUCL 43194) TaxID=747089 RepID=U9TL03_RHIID
MEEDYCQKNKFIPRELKTCPEYGKPRISFGWCKDCETNSMKENFLYWTSENKEIDELIRYTQLNAPQTCDYLEWIPFEKFEMVKYIAKSICNDEKLEIPEDTPKFYAELMQQCWDDDPEKRPNASYLNKKLGEWITLICEVEESISCRRTRF